MNLRIGVLFKVLISLFFLYSSCVCANDTNNIPSLNYKQIQETYLFAQDSFAFGEYNNAFDAYQILSLQKKASQITKARCLKKMGLITTLRGEYSKSKELLSKAKKMLPADKEIIDALNHLAAIKNMDNRDGKNIYIIQVGAYKSSSNANNIIKNIRILGDNFTLKKHKKGKLFIVYFDGFKSKKDADNYSINLKSLNEKFNFFVKQKDIIDNN